MHRTRPHGFTPRRSTRWAAALLTAMALLAAACGGDDDSEPTAAAEPTSESTEAAEPTAAAEADPDTETDPAETPDEEPTAEPEPVELTDSFQGVTATDIKIGVAAIDPEQILEFFGIDLGVFPVQDLYDAMTAGVNEDGGVLGRNVSAVVNAFLPVGAADSERVCTELLDDEEVFVVIGQFIEDNALCITELHGHPYVGHFGENVERQERSNGLLFATEMEQTRQRVGGVTEMIAAGDLDGASVAIYYEAPPDEAYADAVRPLLDEAGINVVGVYSSEATTNDTVADLARTDTVSLRMQADGADLILNVSGIGRIIQSVQSVGWDVTIAMTNGQAADRLSLRDDLSLDDEVLTRTFAVTTDKPVRSVALDDAGVQNCIADYDAMFPENPLDLENDDVVNGVVNHCRAFALTIKIMEAAGADLNPETFVAGAEGLGTFDLPAMVGATLGPDKHSAGTDVRRYDYDASVGYWVPVGEPIPTAAVG